MPESYLRSVINENYKGSKFNQQLSSKQVKQLLSAFRPLSAPSSQHASQTLQPHAVLLIAMGKQFWFTGRPPATEVPSLYTLGMHHRLVSAFPQPQHISDVTLQHGLRSFPATTSYVTHETQDPHYSRAIADAARLEGPSILSLEMQYHHLNFRRYLEHTQSTPSVMQPQPHVNRGPPVEYTPLFSQSRLRSPQHPPYVPESYPQLPLQRESQHQDSVQEYAYLLGGSATQHVSFVAAPQPQPPPLAPPAEASQGATFSYYYSHVGGN